MNPSRPDLPFASSSQRVVLITGASTGIGLALTRILLEDPQWMVIATARSSSLSRLSELGLNEGPRLMIRALDVTHRDEAYHLFEEIENTFGALDVLVNNAGVTFRSVLEHMHHRDEFEQFDANYFGPTRLIRLALPGMRSRRKGHIINVSSVGGMMAMPTMAVYSASKFALEGASEGLWYELRPWNIRVSLVQPGFVRSDGFQHVKFTPEGELAMEQDGKPYHAHYEHMSGFIARIMRRAPDTPEDIARRILRAMKQKRPPLRIPVTFDAHVFAILRRLLPRRVYHTILYRSLPKIKSWGKAAP